MLLPRRPLLPGGGSLNPKPLIRRLSSLLLLPLLALSSSITAATFVSSGATMGAPARPSRPRPLCAPPRRDEGGGGVAGPKRKGGRSAAEEGKPELAAMATLREAASSARTTWSGRKSRTISFAFSSWMQRA
jgi:hypothetical protein